MKGNREFAIHLNPSPIICSITSLTMSNKSLLVILFIISFATHFAFFGDPNQTVFDEVHFGKFISSYYTGEYSFDIHPPLGKLVVAGFAKLFSFKPEFSFAKIGDKFPDSSYLSLRFLPSLAGTILPLMIFLIALEIGLSIRASFLAGFFVSIENALLSQTRFILMDAFLLLFGFASLLLYLKSKHKNSNIKYLLGTGVLGGLAISIKWTGLTFLALPFLIESFHAFKNGTPKNIFRLILFFSIIPTIVYFSIFCLHFSLLTKPGQGDGFMRPGFQNDNIFKKFTDLNKEMYQSNKRLTATHPYSSQWFTWPMMTRPIFYWVDSNPSEASPQVSSRIYSIGNPAIWWSSTIAVMTAILILACNLFLKKKIPLDNRYSIFILLGGYALNLLPFIGIKRIMFLYHYLTALIFAILILIYLID